MKLLTSVNNIYSKTAILIILFFLVPVTLCTATPRKSIRIGVPLNMPPYAFFDPKINATRGFCIDLSLMAGKLLKADIEFFGYNSDAKLLNALQNGQIDVVGCTFMPPFAESEYQLIDTGIKVERHIFTNKSCLTVTCLKDLPNHRIVVFQGHDSELTIFGNSPYTSVSSDSPEEALRLLDAGQADVYVSPNTISTLYQIQKMGFANIKQVGMPFDSAALSLAVLKDRADLLSDLSLALGKIQESEHYQTLNQKWFGRDIKFSIWDRYIKYILMVLAGLALFLTLFAAWSIGLRRQVSRITKDLVSSEKRSRELIESSPDIIHIITSSGQIQMANKRSKELLEGNESDLIEKNLMDIVLPDQKEDMRYFIISLFENGYGENEFTFQGTDGTKVPVEIVATTLKDANQPKTIAACFSRDMRVRKSLEEELILSERLAIMGQMSAGLAHEINNPLGIISGHAQDLLSSDLDEGLRRESLGVIAENADRAGRIVNELLSFSRQRQPIRTPVDLIDILAAGMLFVKAELKRKKITLQKVLKEESIIILGDENQLIQVFVNLLLNAIQAVDGKGLITLGCYTHPPGTPSVAVVEIRDNGPGIKDADIEKVFQPFYSTKETGFGLGLFISSIIVERHNGIMQAESKDAQGTTMKVSLPLNNVNSHQQTTGDRHA